MKTSIAALLVASSAFAASASADISSMPIAEFIRQSGVLTFTQPVTVHHDAEEPYTRMVQVGSCTVDIRTASYGGNANSVQRAGVVIDAGYRVQVDATSLRNYVTDDGVFSFVVLGEQVTTSGKSNFRGNDKSAPVRSIRCTGTTVGDLVNGTGGLFAASIEAQAPATSVATRIGANESVLSASAGKRHLHVAVMPETLTYTITIAKYKGWFSKHWHEERQTLGEEAAMVVIAKELRKQGSSEDQVQALVREVRENAAGLRRAAIERLVPSQPTYAAPKYRYFD